jgi:predicted  nucleic acid-binding Zn-ribbon protein
MASETNLATETLRTLHRIHIQLTDLNARLRRGPNLIRAHQNNVQRCQDQLDAAREQLKKARMSSDAKQGQLRDGEEKVRKLQTQLNMANNNREYQLLKEQIAATEMANSVTADEILEELERIDVFAGKIVEVEAAVAKTQAEKDKVEKQFAEEEPSIRGDVARLEAELKRAEAVLPGDFKPIYHRAVNARNGDALAPVRGEYCDGCNQKVPLNDINKVLVAEPKPLVCRACGRVLYVPEDWSQK